MRVLLINTPYALEENIVPPLSLAYLAGTLEREGIEVQILDFLVSRYSLSKLRQKLSEYKPHLVGATCTTLTYKVASRILKACKDFDLDIVTVIGGPHVSFMIDDTLISAPWIDVVAIGEGDRTLVELVRVIEGSRDLRKVDGIAFREEGVVVRTDPRPYIEDLDKLPLPARYLLPMAKYRALGCSITMITSRGCPYNCIFCSANAMFGKRVRFRDPGLVVDEIEMLDRDFDFLQINIVDDTFTANHKHAGQVCEEILRRNIRTKWSAYARVDTMTKELAELMKRAGCTWVVFGVESADEGILKTIKKGITLDKVRSGVKIATEAGIKVFNSFIFGLPGETPDTARKSMSFAKELEYKYGASFGFHILAPMPGTVIYERAKEYGIRFLTRNWEHYDANRVVTEIPTISVQMVNEAMAIYNQNVEIAQQEIKRRAKEGDSDYIAMVLGQEKQEFIWNLIKHDVLDGLGKITLAKEFDLSEAEAELSRRISLKLKRPIEIVQRQISELLKEGLLQLQPDGDGLKWLWSDGRRPGLH
ncbi:MAG: radical SAM protein [Deferribacterota bacterium]|nr:radical SAM protein [Deferribacterota bacterium]